MGRIRKALSITSVIATGGAIGTPVKWESAAEKAAREQQKLMQEQNDLLAQLARQGQRPATAPRPVARVKIVCCLECINEGCDQAMGEVGWTRDVSECACVAHHE